MCAMCSAQVEECSTAFGEKNSDWGYGRHICLAFEGHTMEKLVAMVGRSTWCVFRFTHSGSLPVWSGPDLASTRAALIIT